MESRWKAEQRRIGSHVEGGESRPHRTIGHGLDVAFYCLPDQAGKSTFHNAIELLPHPSGLGLTDIPATVFRAHNSERMSCQQRDASCLATVVQRVMYAAIKLGTKPVLTKGDGDRFRVTTLGRQDDRGMLRGALLSGIHASCSAHGCIWVHSVQAEALDRNCGGHRIPQGHRPREEVVCHGPAHASSSSITWAGHATRSVVRLQTTRSKARVHTKKQPPTRA